MLSRDEMSTLFQVGVQAADPAQAVHRACTALAHTAPTHVIAFGKAACAMASAALNVLPSPRHAIVVTNPENARPVAGADLWTAAHPVPDGNGQRAANAIMAMLEAASGDDRVLALVSGGASALLPAPVAGLSLDDKAEVSRVLLGAGLDIVAMNAVRQHLSQLKGGGFVRIAAPAPVTALILSDVIGDDLRAIASGPTASPLLPRAEVVELLHAAQLWEQLPAAARTALSRTESQPLLTEARNILIGSNAKSLDAMAAARKDAHRDPEPLVGDVADAAQRVVAQLHAGPGITLMGGETTVQLRGDGRGGRNQELALRVALALDGRAGWRFLSAGTDGRDGPTEAAGAIVDGTTCARIRTKGGDPEQLLANNDSFAALELAGDLLITGGTGTNVADLQILSVAK
ncbi:MAG: DUF4147 domain-containing protein [Rhodobacteraceae bacterium]|nr:MAG: DUF4147 domain-containing protein [Paracoccaceae bacterium]